MEVSNFSALYLKPRLNQPSFFKHANDFITLDCQEFRNLHGYYSNSNGRMFGSHLFTRRLKHCSLVLGRNNDTTGASCLPVSHSLSSRAPTLKLQSGSRILRLCPVMREESEESLTGDSILMNEEVLEQELQVAIKEENYAQAAKIRDSLQHLQQDSKARVLAINARFYNAYREGDLAAMQVLWLKRDRSCVVHAGVSGIFGYDNVMASWDLIWAGYKFPTDIQIRDVHVYIKEDVGYLTCTERIRSKGGSWGHNFTTNVFEKIKGKWFICIHHVSFVER